MPSRWRHQMETFSALLTLCAGNSPVIGEFPAQRPVTRNFDIFFDCAWTNGWVNNRDVGDLKRHRAYYSDIIMSAMAFQFTLDCLLNRLFRRRSNKTLQNRVDGLWEGTPPVNGGFPSQMANNPENVSMTSSCYSDGIYSQYGWKDVLLLNISNANSRWQFSD